MEVCLLWVLCVVKQRSLRRADHQFREVLPSGVCLCMIAKIRQGGPGPLSSHAIQKKNQEVYEKLFDYVHVLLLVRAENFLVLKTENIPKCHRKTLPFLILFHIFHSVHYKWFKNPYSTNQCAFLLLCTSLLISSYMFRHNCHHQGANSYIAKTYSKKTVLQCLRISSVQVIVKIDSVKML